MECKGIELFYSLLGFLTLFSRFRWVFCQLEALRHCFPSNLRQFLNKLPDTLDETYERMLRGINKARADDASRLFQCLTVAVRPLRVDELAELLALDFQATSSGRIPTLKKDWRWDDQEEAILSTCSSFISIISNGDERMVQFSHFSVKEFLTSSRLMRSPHEDVSRFHIDLGSAHTIMAQACLGTLLRPNEHAGDRDADGSPLLEYAARHWVEHAGFKNVSSRLREGMDDLFDSSRPHFSAWLQVHDMDETWAGFSTILRKHNGGSPLYYAVLCGFYDLAKRLIRKHPEQVNARSGRILAPLPAALYKRHFRLANLLFRYGADVDCRGIAGRTLLLASSLGSVDVMRWLINHGADVNARTKSGETPLHLAAFKARTEGVQVLLEHNASIDSQDNYGKTPLYSTIYYAQKERQESLDIARRLLEHGADPNISTYRPSTALHCASSCGLLKVARLLLSHGAKVDVKDRDGRTPSQVAASEGHHDFTKLLLEHGAVSLP